MLYFHLRREVRIPRKAGSFFYDANNGDIVSQFVYLIEVTSRSELPEPARALAKRGDAFREWFGLVHDDLVVMLCQDLIRYASRPECGEVRVILDAIPGPVPRTAARRIG